MHLTKRGEHHLHEDELQETWVRFKTDRDMKARSALILHYHPKVVAIAWKIASRLPVHVDREDLVSYGLVGLIDAIEKFDLSRKLVFETYAGTRIYGQVMDELRKLDWVPRSVRNALRDAKRAQESLEEELHRPPTAEELAERLSVSVDVLKSTLAEGQWSGMLTLDGAPMADGAGTPIDYVDRSIDVDGELQIDGIKSTIASAVVNMAEREAVVLALYYIEGLNLSEIGRLLGVTESRVCQMHNKAIADIRLELAA